MAYFRVTYLDDDGYNRHTVCEAQNEIEAADICGIPRNRIERVAVDSMAALKMAVLKPKLSLKEQAGILSSLCAQMLGGKEGTRALIEVCSRRPSLRARIPQGRGLTKLSEYLAEMGFNDHVVLMATIGEESNDIARTLSSAATDIIKRQEALAEISKGLLPAIGMVLVGLNLMVGVSIYAEKEVFSKTAGGIIKITPNGATNFMRALAHISTDYWYVVVGVVIALFVGRGHIWPHLKKVPPFTIATEYARLRRAMDFILAFKPLVKAGVKDNVAIPQIQKRSTGDTAKAFAYMLDKFAEGRSIADGFDNDFWPMIMQDAAPGLAANDVAVRVVTLERLEQLVKQDLDSLVTKITRIMKTLGMLLSSVVIMMMFYGMMAPMMQASTSSMSNGAQQQAH